MYADILEIVFQFKGNREYVHGTDLFNKIICNFKQNNIKKIKFSVHDLIKNPNCEIYIFDCEPSVPSGKFRGSFDLSDKRVWIELRESKRRPTEVKRVLYEEKQVTDLCEITNETIILHGISPFSFIETIISMNKHLLNTINPSQEAKWFYTGIELFQYQDIRSRLNLSITHNFQNKLVKSVICQDEHWLGTVYFSLQKL